MKLTGDLTSPLASKYLGGGYGYSGGYISAITIDSNGNIYLTGSAWSSDFPTTPGAYDTFFNGGHDAFVSKLSSDLSNLLVSTYLGGSDDDYGNAIVIDTDGNVYVTGSTGSSDFPTIPGAYDISFSGYYEAFVSKLTGDLTSLLASTYLGGAGWASARSIAIDIGGNIYVTRDSTVLKLNDTLTSLLASISLSGGIIEDIAIDSGGDVYVAGSTSSPNFPITMDAYDTSFNGRDDIFVSKLNSDLTSLLASTYLGGSNWDYGRSIAIDSWGDVYVTGWTNSSEFPTTADAYDTFKDGWTDAFISKLSGDLTKLIASTYLGGSSGEFCYSLTIDSGGNVYIAGSTSSSDFPTTPGAYDTSFNGIITGNDDAFVSKLNSDLTSLLASTYFGGSSSEFCRSVAIASNGDIYVTGATWSSDFPTTTCAYDSSLAGYSGGPTDVFVSKFDSNLSANPVTAPNDTGYCAPSLEIINDLVTFNPIRSTYQTTSDTTGCGDGFVGQFSFDVTLTNKSNSPPLTDLVVEVIELTNNNVLQNADGVPGEVGAKLTVPNIGDYADGVLSPGETVDVTFIICLTEIKSFGFVVDVLGIKDGQTDSLQVAELQSTAIKPGLTKFEKGSGVKRKGFFLRFHP